MGPMTSTRQARRTCLEPPSAEPGAAIVPNRSCPQAEWQRPAGSFCQQALAALRRLTMVDGWAVAINTPSRKRLGGTKPVPIRKLDNRDAEEDIESRVAAGSQLLLHCGWVE